MERLDYGAAAAAAAKVDRAWTKDLQKSLDNRMKVSPRQD